MALAPRKGVRDTYYKRRVIAPEKDKPEYLIILGASTVNTERVFAALVTFGPASLLSFCRSK